ncbi:MFS transporter [Paenibacillus marinisediminis]
MMFYATNAILIPYLSLYLQKRGFSPAETGTLIMLGPFLAMFLQPLVGVISDKLKATKPLLLVLWIGVGLSSVFLFMTDQRAVIAVSLLAFYIFMQPAVSLLDTLLIKGARSLNVSYSSLRVFGSIGFMVALLIIGQRFEAWGGLDSLLIMFAPIWIGVFIIFVLLREPAVEEPQAKAGSKMDMAMMRKTLASPALLFFFGLILLLGIPHRMNDGMLSLHLQDLNASAAQISYAWAAAGAGEVIGFILIARFVQQKKLLSLLATASLLYAIRWLLYAYVTVPSVIVVLQASHAFTFAAVWILSIDYVTRALPKQMLATGQALLNMIFIGLGGLIGGSLGGLLQENYGDKTMYLFGAVCSLIAAVGFFIWNRRARSVAVMQECSKAN